MSQPSQPVAIPGRDSPRDVEDDAQHSASSPDITPGTSPGSKRKREEEDDNEQSKDADIRQIKKRRTPPSESPPDSKETPRVGLIQKQVEDMKMNRRSLDGPSIDIDDLAKSSAADEPQVDPEQNVAEQSSSTPPKEEKQKMDDTVPETESQDIETDSDEAAAPVETGIPSPIRRRVNGLKKIPNLDRPIEVDSQELNRKRKASEKLPGSPFASPAAKRAKEDDLRIKSTILEEKLDYVKNPSPPRSPAKPILKGFSAFASVASPFAAVKTDNSPFGGGTRPSALFGGSIPKFVAPVSPFSAPATSEIPSVFFQAKVDNGDPTQDLAKDKTPFPSISKSPLFGASSSLGSSTSSAPKSVFGRPSAFGVVASPVPSAVGPTRRAKSPRPHAFGAYGTTAGRFAAPSGKIRAKNKAEGENGDKKDSDEGTSEEEKVEESKPRSFSEILAATGSDAESSEGEKMIFTEQDTVTGEEDEMNVFHGRGKLYDRESGNWKERGAGLFKLNVNKETGLNPRILMRRDGTLSLLLNAPLFKGMKFSAGPDPRYVNFVILDENLKPKAHLLRFHTAKHAQDLLDRVQTHIPT